MIETTTTISLSEYNELKLHVLKIPELIKTIEILQEQIRFLRNGKNSGTSHTSPSHQIGRPNAKSLRDKTDSKSGGQPGHEGTTLR